MLSDALKRRERERAHIHRALLLYAMQAPHKRSKRAVARALKKDPTTIGYYSREWDWDNRAAVPMAEELAVQLYRELYLKAHGEFELPHVAGNVLASLSASPSRAGRVPDDRVIADLKEADRIAREEILRRKDERASFRKQQIDLVDGALGYIVQEMTQKRVRASLRDIPTLLKVREMLVGDGEHAQSSMPALETVRVRTARETGGSVIEAMQHDLSELQLILTALQAAEGYEAEQLTEGSKVAEGGSTGQPGALTVIDGGQGGESEG